MDQSMIPTAEVHA